MRDKLTKKEREERMARFTVMALLIIIALSILFGGYDLCYREPVAAETANLICQEQGYDFYESFSRIGLFSSTPVAIKCKYVDNYKEMDIALRQTYGGSE